MTKKNNFKVVTAVDLFCGAGGLTYGFQQAGLKVNVGFDIDPSCAYPFEKNNNSKFILADVANLPSEQVNEWFKGSDIKVLAGCAPCQPFSTYSKSKNNDHQWSLLRSFSRLVRECEPDIVSMENVPQLVKHNIFNEFCNDLRALNYHVWYSEVPCQEYEVPQTRRRLVLLASKLAPIGPLETLTPFKSNYTVRDAISKLDPIKAGETSLKDPLHTACSLSKLNLERIKASKPGGSWRDWTPELVAKCHLKDSGITYPSVYGRMEWDEPAPTITTQCFGFGNGRFGHPEQDRAISLREAALLQTFPQNYEFLPPGRKITFKNIGRLIGNAVPVNLAKAIGTTILNHVQSFA
jgi:DNA (cytosine-5)-methyltransferase 1